MPMLKTITGHTGCAGVMDYLRKGSKDDRRKRRMGEISEAVCIVKLSPTKSAL